jgi:transposase-like protein
MDLARSVYSRDLKIVAMRALDAGSTTSEIARKYQLSPKLLERWRGEWRAKGELAFPGTGRRGAPSSCIWRAIKPRTHAVPASLPTMLCTESAGYTASRGRDHGEPAWAG